MAFKMKGWSPFTQKDNKRKKIDPDAPGTPGKPGYEPPVKRSDLDDKGKAIWDAHRAKKKKKTSPFDQKDDKKKKIKSTISDKEAKGINIQDISAVQEKDGQKFVHTLTDKETYEDTPFDPSIKRDTIRVSDKYPKGHLIDETQWEKGKATKKNTKIPKWQIKGEK